MSKTTIILNLIEGMSDEEIAVVGTYDQVLLTKSETGKRDVIEFYNTVAEAEEQASNWNSEE